ncbi:hypothetical protein LFE_0695 [Leptospirillum ferrooxidans C2-3]|jgi:hypothetical protein|uniref:Uncharacterized protein n=1 Tax=Leptospirillum ferrooxidans (strain C2-3) TaxID=1162668 RepID=I0IMB1_LEPFC|nr:hypothetical protein LFE_0695 [Leptospirillum ferrooxidans C2-3]
MGVFVIIYVSEEARVNKTVNPLGRLYQEKFQYSTMDHEKTVGLFYYDLPVSRISCSDVIKV